MNKFCKSFLSAIITVALLCFSLCVAGCEQGGGESSGTSAGGRPWPPASETSEITSSGTSSEDSSDANERAVTFLDEFEGDAVNKNNWEFQIGNGSQYGIPDWGNGEAQYYREQNASVENGALKITLKKESYGGKDYTSARMRTKGKFSQTYGRFEARIKIEGGSGLWPAFWMMPENDVYGGWPFSGEIDIMEIKGRKETMSSAAVHFAARNSQHQYKTREEVLPSGTIHDYHVYAVEWQRDKMEFSVDGKVFLTVSEWMSGSNAFPAPFNQDFHIILNLACGGHFDGYLLPKDSQLPAAMYVDYVKVYAPL